MQTPPLAPMMAGPGGLDPSQDMYRLLLKERIVFLGSEVNDQVANLLIAQLIYLEYEDPNRDIWLYINSPGGVVTAGLAIYDTMKFIKPDVATYCMGQAASMGAVLLCAGADGKRSALPNSRIMIHQPLGGTQGQASDIEIYTKEMLKTREQLNGILAHHTRQPLERIERDTDRNFFMSAAEAKDYGIVDHVINKRADSNLPTPTPVQVR